jgi:hypothetical protein
MKLSTIAALGFLLALTTYAIKTMHGQQAQPDNTEMRQIFDEDQKDRDWGTQLRPGTAQMNKMLRDDALHQKRVRELLADDKLRTGKDFLEASFVFQHGDKPDDYLLAHILALVSIAKGNPEGRWISAATLDRYLQKIDQPQVFGTQYFTKDMSAGAWTQEPFNRVLVPEALRKNLCVPDLAQQSKVLESMNKNQEPDVPKVCP